MKERENVQIDIRSREFRDLLVTLPRWPVRWGMVVTLSVLIILFLIGRNLKSPDRIIARIIFTEQNPVGVIRAATNGSVSELYVTDDQVVEKGELLCLIDPSGPDENVFGLAHDLDSLLSGINHIQNQGNSVSRSSLLLKDLNSCTSQFQEWGKTHLLISPVAGRINFVKTWEAGDTLTSDSVVFYVVAAEPSRITGQILLPAAVGRKVAENQRVIVKDDGFTAGGSVKPEGIVSKVTRMDPDGKDSGYYTIEVLFKDNLKSAYVLSRFTTGCWEAEIITGNRNFIKRIFEPLRSLLNRSMLTN